METKKCELKLDIKKNENDEDEREIAPDINNKRKRNENDEDEREIVPDVNNKKRKIEIVLDINKRDKKIIVLDIVRDNILSSLLDSILYSISNIDQRYEKRKELFKAIESDDNLKNKRLDILDKLISSIEKEYIILINSEEISSLFDHFYSFVEFFVIDIVDKNILIPSSNMKYESKFLSSLDEYEIKILEWYFVNLEENIDYEIFVYIIDALKKARRYTDTLRYLVDNEQFEVLDNITFLNNWIDEWNEWRWEEKIFSFMKKVDGNKLHEIMIENENIFDNFILEFIENFIPDPSNDFFSNSSSFSEQNNTFKNNIAVNNLVSEVVSECINYAASNPDSASSSTNYDSKLEVKEVIIRDILLSMKADDYMEDDDDKEERIMLSDLLNNNMSEEIKKIKKEINIFSKENLKKLKEAINIKERITDTIEFVMDEKLNLIID